MPEGTPATETPTQTPTNTPAPVAQPPTAGPAPEPTPGPAARMVVGKVAEHEERIARVEKVLSPDDEAPAGGSTTSVSTEADAGSWLTLW